MAEGDQERDRARRAARLRAQLLTEPSASTPGAVVEHLLAVQAQDLQAARLALRARSTGFTAADVDRAIAVDRSLVVGWLNRGTLHLVPAEDYWWLHALTTPRIETTSRRRLAQEGVSADDAERGVRTITAALEHDGALTRKELGARLRSRGVAAEGQGVVHLLALAAARGLLVRGPFAGRIPLGGPAGTEQAFVLARDWLPAPSSTDPAVALAELARRYLTGHGPASEADLARWAGISLTAARAGMTALGEAVARRSDSLHDLTRRGPGGADLPPPRLLGAFDPVLLGWRSRQDLLGAHAADVVSGGVFRPFALADGRAVALWRIARGTVAVSPFEPLPPDVVAALDQDGRDVARFLGDTVDGGGSLASGGPQ